MNTPDRKDPDSPERDAELRRAWQQASHEQPSSRLDGAIRAAAHEAVRSRVTPAQAAHGHARSWLSRWQPLAAAAAVTGLAFVLVQMLPRDDRDVAPSLQVEAPAVVDSTGTEPNERVVPEPSAVSPAAADRQSANSRTRSEAVADRAPEASAAGVAQEEATAPKASTELAPAGAAAPGIAAKEGIATSVSAADWAARVAALHDAGDTAQAADALRAFRAAYPEADGYLSESLRDWALTIE